MSTISVRPARPSDLKEILRVERASWGEGVGSDSMASEATIRGRIALLNGFPPGWFWVALQGRKVLGDFVLQPTSMPPEECVSWAQATDGGQLVQTFNPEGGFVYGVSLAVPPGAPPATADLLVHAIHALRLETGKRTLYACARMSGFQRAHGRTAILPDDYWRLQREDGTPRDPFLHLFWTMIGLKPARLLRDGYPPDAESGGHGVLCVSEDPFGDIVRSAQRILNANVSLTRKGAIQ